MPTKTKCSTPTPTLTCCQSRGSPGWNDKVHAGAASRIDVNSTTPQDCCKADPDCFQWESVGNAGSVDFVCLLFPVFPDNGDACSNGILTPGGA
ncbi:36790_t:CDS:1, partial [Racocetra persica]